MSLCSLIYNDTQGISSANDLIQIMNIGIQLYSSLSWLARQAYLMQSELPTALNVFDTDYQLEYSESYSGTVHQEIAIEGYQYCRSLRRAFESLISESYTNFILTVGCITVATYYNSNMGFKIFDSHARDLYCSCWMTISTIMPLIIITILQYVSFLTKYIQNEKT